MELASRDYINMLTKRIVDNYHISMPITNIEDIVHKMGGTIKTRKGFDDLCEGTVAKVGDAGFRIIVSAYQNEQQKTISVARELGHLFLHMGFRTSPDLWQAQEPLKYKRFRTTEQENQANEFAISLLMPRDKFKKVLLSNSQDGNVDITAVADFFKTSEDAVLNRGISLGLLAYVHEKANNQLEYDFDR